MKKFSALCASLLTLGTSAQHIAQAGEKPAFKVFVRWTAFAPSVLSPSASMTTRTSAARARLQNQLQSVVPGAWVGRTFDRVGWSVVAVPAAQKGVALAKLRRAFGASNVEAVHTRRLYRTPDDPNFGEQWWLQKIGAPSAWDTSTGSTSVIVAVVDTGASLSHPELAGQLWTNPGEIAGNGLDDDGNGYVDDVNGFNAIHPGSPPEDDDADASHGTHVSGIIGAKGNNARQVSGINWNVQILPVKVFDQNGNTPDDDTGIVSGLNYVLALKARGVNIRATNDSWGGPDTSQVLFDAFSRLNGAGILNFIAAGNGERNGGVGFSLDTLPEYPSSYTFPTIVSVGATDENDAPTKFSNYGPRTVDIFAPGTDILSLARGGATEYLDGTSMSTPVVTGAAALLWSIKPSLSAAEMKALLLKSSFRAPSLRGTSVSNGRLDLAQAVSLVSGSPTPTPTPTATPTPAPTATPTPRPTATPTPVPSGPFSLSGYTFFKENGANHPVAGAAVYLNNRFVTTSGASGVYSIKGLQAGNYSLSARLGGYSFAPVALALTGTGGRVRRDILATAPATRYSITGTVRNASGTALRGVPVLLNNQPVPIATTDSAGRFTLKDRARGTYTLSAKINGSVVGVRVALPATTGTRAPNAEVVLQPRATTSSGSGGSS